MKKLIFTLFLMIVSEVYAQSTGLPYPATADEAQSRQQHVQQQAEFARFKQDIIAQQTRRIITLQNDLACLEHSQTLDAIQACQNAVAARVDKAAKDDYLEYARTHRRRVTP